MENLNVSKDIQEQYVDATVAAFMEQYADALQVGADQVTADTAHGEFPEALDERCRKLLEQARAKRRRKQILRSCMRVCRSAAVLVLVLMCVGTTLLFTVESFRIPVMNLVFERMDAYTEITSKQAMVMDKKVGTDVDLNDPLRLILEGDFQLTSIENHWEDGQLIAQYESSYAEVIFFVENYSGVLQIDTEDAVVTTPIIMDYEVMMVAKGDRRALVWADEQKGRVYELYTIGFSEIDAADLCAQTIILFNA